MTQTNKISNKKGDVIIDASEMKRIKKHPFYGYCEQLQASKLNNPEEMKKFLEKIQLTK